MEVEDHISWAEVVASNFRKEKRIPIEREEAVSLGMVGLMKAARNYRKDKGKFRSLAWVKIRGELKDWVKMSVRRNNFVPMVSLENLPIERLLSVNGTEKKVVDKDLVEKAFGFVTARQEQLIRLYYLEGYLMKDIAESLGVTESNVSFLIRKGMRKMRRIKLFQ